MPGLIVTQHSGEGKANQYFLRGFNLDHGTDLSIKIDGMPVNMPTHGHGQGYADINFMISELIQSVNVRKGPYFADVGDFASAGALEIDYITKLPKNIAEMTNGIFGYHRGLAADPHRCRCGYAARRHRRRQIQRPVGRTRQCAQDQRRDALQPGHRDRRADAYGDGLFQRLELDRSGGAARPRSGRPSAGSVRSIRPMAAFPAASEPVREFCAFERVRAEQAQCLHRALPPTCSSTTISPICSTIPSTATSSTSSTAAPSAASTRGMPSIGDLAASRRKPASACRARYDDIRVGLFKTEQRTPLSTVREDRVQEGNVGIWMDTTTRWTDWLRSTVGIREDHLCGACVERHAGKLRQRTGIDGEPEGRHRAWALVQDRVLRQCRLRPALERHPRRDDLRRSHRQGDTAGSRTAAGSIEGRRVFPRTKAVEGLTSSLAAFVLDFDSLGSVMPAPPRQSRPSRRVGVEWTNQYQILPWMRFDLDVAYTRARFSDFDPAGDFIPGAPAWVASRRRDVRRRERLVRRAAWALFRSASADRGRQCAFAVIPDLQCAGRLQISMDALQLDVLNLFNAKTNQIEYYYLSRLPGEAIDGVADRHVHPAEPLAVRLTLAGRF